MHFLVHGLDMHYALPRLLYERTSSELAVFCSGKLRFYLVLYLNEHALLCL